jgi:recombination protein RecA
MALKLTVPKGQAIEGEILPPIAVSEELLAKPKTSAASPVIPVSQQKVRSMKDRLKDLELVSAACDKDWGTKHSLIRMGDRVNVPIPSVPTGIITFDDEVLGCGGTPRGRVIEVIGPESSGKTTIALMMIACFQALGEIAAVVDAEHALDPTYASKLGVDVPNLLICQPDHGEHALGVTESLVRSGLVSVIIIDSVAALVPKAELEGDMGDSHMGLQARLMSQALRKLTGIASKSGTTLIFINQIREKIGVMFGSPETTTGGRALKFYSSIRLDVRRVADIKDGDHIIGHTIKTKAIKNKVATPKKESLLDLYYPGESDITGFDKMGDLVTYAEQLGVAEKSGSWYSFKGERIGQGLAKAASFMRENPEMAAKMVAQIKAVRENK